MSQRTFQLPLRTLVRPKRHGSAGAQWACRRCLATQSEDPLTTPNPVPFNTDRLTSQRTLKPASEAENYDPKLPFSQRDYHLTKTEHYLKRPLRHLIPPQYLAHSTSDLLPRIEQERREELTQHKPLTGVVVRAGKMDKTVTVRIPKQTWNRKIKKHFRGYDQHLVHDPNNSLVAGDVVSLHKLHISSTVFHVVASIVAPFGTPIGARPPVPSADERLAAYKEKRFAKLLRRDLRRRATEGDVVAINKLLEMGLDPGVEVETDAKEAQNVEKGSDGKRASSKTTVPRNKAQKPVTQRIEKDRALAKKFEAQAEDNILEAIEKVEDLAEKGIVTEPKIPFQNPVIDPPESKVKNPKGI